MFFWGHGVGIHQNKRCNCLQLPLPGIGTFGFFSDTGFSPIKTKLHHYMLFYANTKCTWTQHTQWH